MNRVAAAAVGCPGPQVWPGLPAVELEDFSRLNLQNTVLSKRKLTELVDGGKARRRPALRSLGGVTMFRMENARFHLLL